MFAVPRLTTITETSKEELKIQQMDVDETDVDFEASVITRCNILFKEKLTVNFNEKTQKQGKQNCQLTLVHSVHFVNALSMSGLSTFIPDKKLCSDTGEYIIPDVNDNVAYAFLQADRKGYVKELTSKLVSEEMRLKIDMVDNAFLLPVVREEMRSKLAKINVNIKEVRAGMVPFYRQDLASETLTTERQRKLLLEEILRSKFEFNNYGEMFFLCKLIWKKKGSHFILSYLQGNETRISVLVYLDLQQAAPKEVCSVPVAGNSVFDVLPDEAEKDLQAVIFYKLSSKPSKKLHFRNVDLFG